MADAPPLIVRFNLMEWATPSISPMRSQRMNPSKPTLLGIPFDANSSYLRGAADAPPLIREAYHCDSSNSSTESGIELSAESILDAGDLALPPDSAFPAIESAVGELLDKGQRPVCLGGDHSITYPIVRAFAKRFADLTIVHFDAHPDLYDEFQGSRYSHACPFARIMEEGLAKKLIQLGIRTMVALNENRRLALELKLWRCEICLPSTN
jgi:arginase family enzyme